MFGSSQRSLLTLICCVFIFPAIATGCRKPLAEVTSEPIEDKKEISQNIQEISASLNAAKEILAEEVKVTKPWKIALVIKTVNPQNPYWARVVEGGKQAGEKLGIEVQVFSTNKVGPVKEYVEDQIKEVLKVIEQGDIDGMVIAPVESARMIPVIEKAIDAGIPTVVLEFFSSDRVLTYVQVDYFAATQTIGEWVVGELDGKGKVLLLNGILGETVAIKRRDGFLAGLGTGDIEILAMESGLWSSDKAQEITSSWLDRFPEIDAILAANDRMALGAIDAIEAADREGILVAGFDGIEEAFDAIEAGKLSVTADQEPDLQALLGIKALVLHLEDRRTFDLILSTPELPLITKENVTDYAKQKRVD